MMASSLWFIAFALAILSISAQEPSGEESSGAGGNQLRPQDLLGVQLCGVRRRWQIVGRVTIKLANRKTAISDILETLDLLFARVFSIGHFVRPEDTATRLEARASITK